MNTESLVRRLLLRVEEGQVKDALGLALLHHCGVKRLDGEPYVNHVIRTAIVVCEGFEGDGQLRPSLARISLLHDAIEDPSASGERLDIEKVRVLLSVTEFEAVVALTKVEALSERFMALKRMSRKEINWSRVINSGWMATAVKLSDYTDNVETIPQSGKSLPFCDTFLAEAQMFRERSKAVSVNVQAAEALLERLRVRLMGTIAQSRQEVYSTSGAREGE